MRRRNAPVILLLLLLAAALAVLATLQYRWIDRISDAERKQMRENANFAARRFAGEVSRALQQLHETFVADGDIVEQYRATPHRALVRNVYLIDRSAGDWTLHLVGEDGVEEVEWPAELLPMRDRMPRVDPERRGPPQLPEPLHADLPALFVVEPRGARPRGLFGGPPRIVLVHLDPRGLADFVMTRDGYDLAVMSGSRLLYRSDAAWPDGKTPPDIDLAVAPFGDGPPWRRGSAGVPPADAGEAAAGRRRHQPAGTPALLVPPPLRVLVRRHDATVDAIVAGARRRNLAISFAILLVLGITVAVLVMLLRRAERLRQQQNEFVAAISHELNTPVAALRSAGENLRDGIVHDPEKLARYGGNIVRESARLGELTSQILELAGMQERRARLFAPVAVASVIEDAIAQCAPLIEKNPVTIETEIEPDLPEVRVDLSSITRAVQNLIANAIRHGGAGGWVGVRAARDGKCVTITVEDRGPGIDPSDAAQLFDAFYRGRNSTAVPGAGLGLAIVRQIAIAHGGSVRLVRPTDRRRTGAAFTIELPAVSHA
jgi:signal transduction histidine kinase